LSTGDSRGVDLSPTLSDERKDLSSKVTLQRSNGIEFGMPFCDPTSNVVLGSRHREFLKAIARSPLPARNWFCLTMPLGLRPGVDYLSVFSADNFGLGAIATEPSSPYVSGEGVVGMLTDRADFFFTHEREIAFRKWISAERPDVTLVRGLRQSRAAGAACQRLLAENDDLDCVFVAWDVPALSILSAMRKGARSLPMITVDLGNEIAAELRRDGPLKGIAAQRRHDQPAAAASAVLLGLIGRSPPAWVTSTGLLDPGKLPRGVRGRVARAGGAVTIFAEI
jgi:Periplasmic binding protein domain